MRSESRIVLMRCAIVIIVRLENKGERSVVWSRASVSTSTAAVASSRTRMLDGVRRARARETSWRWPWERLDPLCDGVSICFGEIDHTVVARLECKILGKKRG
jgi:hypothetical protein